MAKKDDRKKQKKRKKEALKAKKWAVRDEFPRIEILFDGTDEAFMLAVENIIHTFDYGNEEHCPDISSEAFRMLRRIGIERMSLACSNPELLSKDGGDNSDMLAYIKHLVLVLRIHLGAWVFARLPKQYTQNPLPYYYFDISPTGRGLVLTFKFLPRKDLGTQSVWHSPLDPLVEIREKQYRVGFTKHVFEQACKRMLLKEPLEYFQMRLVADYFRRCVYFEHVLLEDGQDALRLFYPCEDPFSDLYLRDVAALHEHEMAPDEWSFIVGYCPVVLDESGYAISKTLLFPGYTNTPEAARVNSTRMNPILRSQLQKAAQDNTLGRVFMEKNIQPLRWYHHNGVPQVFRLNKPIFNFG